jgi:hypothetical protein
MMPPSSSTVRPDKGSPLSDLCNFGSIQFTTGNADMTFQIDIIPSETPSEVWFGILNLPLHSHTPATGFAIRIDFALGEIWDAQNETGLLGTIETNPASFEEPEQPDSFLLSLKLEKRGGNLLPHLELGGKSYLYPAISLASLASNSMTAVAGTVQKGRDAAPFCHFPAFWLSDSNS